MPRAHTPMLWTLCDKLTCKVEIMDMRGYIHAPTHVDNILKLDGKYSERVQLPAKAKFWVLSSPTLGNTCHTYYLKYKM